jgi:hypothetical protein
VTTKRAMTCTMETKATPAVPFTDKTALSRDDSIDVTICEAVSCGGGATYGITGTIDGSFNTEDGAVSRLRTPPKGEYIFRCHITRRVCHKYDSGGQVTMNGEPLNPLTLESFEGTSFGNASAWSNVILAPQIDLAGCRLR